MITMHTDENVPVSEKWLDRAAKLEASGDQEKADRFFLKALAAVEREKKEGV